MSKLERKLQKIFAEESQSTQVTAFRTAGTNPTYTKDVTEIQNANFTKGWLDPNNTGNVVPYAEDMNGLFYTLSRNIAYLNQSGIPEWLSTETYYENAMCMYNGVLYISLADNNLGKQPDTQTSYWRAYASPVSGSVTGGENLGTGEGIYKDAVGGIMQFKGLVAGNNITLTPSVDGTSITIDSTGGGGSGSVAWGDITGSLASQVDLSTALSQRGTLSGANTWTGNNTFNKILPVNINSTIGDSNNLWTIYQSYIIGDETFYFSYEDQRVENSRFLLGLYGGEMGLFPAMSSQDNYKSSLGSSVLRWDNLYTDYANINSAYITTISSVGTIVSPYDYQGNQSRIALSYNPPVLGGSPTQWGWMGYLSSSYIGLFPSTTETGSLGSPNNKWKEAYIKTIHSDSIPTNLQDLSNVTISSAANNQFLRYNGSNWTNQTVTIPSNLQDLSNVTISSAANGNYLKYDGSKWVNAAFPSTRVLKINNTDKVTVYCTSSGGAIDFGSYLPLNGGTMTGNIVPSGTRNLGSSNAYWADVFTHNCHCGAYASLSKYSTYGVQLIWTSSGNLTSVIGDGTAFFPSTNKTMNLGGTNNRWGTIYGISAVNTSDRRIKKNIVELTDALEKLNTIAVKSYTVDCISYGINYGFIAQDELERNPELIFVPEDYSEEEGGGELGFINNNVLFLAVKAIQELSAKVENLENQLRELRQ